MPVTRYPRDSEIRSIGGGALDTLHAQGMTIRFAAHMRAVT
jgi:hypothetical protein